MAAGTATSSAGATCCGSGASAVTSLDWSSTSRTASPDPILTGPNTKPGGSVAPDKTRVVVVTGGAAGIGAAIAEEAARAGAFVVTVDPGVNLDGSARLEAATEPTTAERIVAAGGRARASN